MPIVIWTNAWAAVTNVASDPDTPPQALTFGLCGGPAGATIDPATGVFRYYADGTRADTTNRFCVSVTDDGVPPSSATQTLTVIVRPVNTRPVLDPIATQAILPGEYLWLTNSAHDPDVPPQTLAFGLSAGPTNAAISPDTGVFTWYAESSRAGTTNTFCVFVQDDGSPRLGATQCVAVIVQDMPGLTIGSTALVLRTTSEGSVPLTIYHGPDVADLTFTLTIPGNRMTGVAWTNLQPKVAWATLHQSGANRFEARIQTKPGQALSDTERIVDLRFTWSVEHSGAVPLLLSDITAVRRDGRGVPQIRAESGRVVVVKKEPVLDGHVHTNGHRSLTLHGLPDTQIVHYIIEFSTDLLQWTQDQVIPMPSGEFRVRVDLDPADRAIFFRVRDPRP